MLKGISVSIDQLIHVVFTVPIITISMAFEITKTWERGWHQHAGRLAREITVHVLYVVCVNVSLFRRMVSQTNELSVKLAIVCADPSVPVHHVVIISGL